MAQQQWKGKKNLVFRRRRIDWARVVFSTDYRTVTVEKFFFWLLTIPLFPRGKKSPRFRIAAQTFERLTLGFLAPPPTWYLQPSRAERLALSRQTRERWCYATRRAAYSSSRTEKTEMIYYVYKGSLEEVETVTYTTTTRGGTGTTFVSSIPDRPQSLTRERERREGQCHPITSSFNVWRACKCSASGTMTGSIHRLEK